MLRYLLILHCLVALPSRFHSAFAQHSGIGIKGGALLSETRSAKLNTNTIPGVTAGAYFALRAGDRLELQPEVLLTSLGSGYTLSDGERAVVRTLYMQMPVCAKAYIGNTFNAQGGFLMGRLLLAQQNAPDGTTDITESYATWDYGIVLGLGADLITGLDLGLRYYNGLRPVLVSDEVYFPLNRSYQFTVGYRLGRLKPVHITRKRG